MGRKRAYAMIDGLPNYYPEHDPSVMTAEEFHNNFYNSDDEERVKMDLKHMKPTKREEST